MYRYDDIELHYDTGVIFDEHASPMAIPIVPCNEAQNQDIPSCGPAYFFDIESYPNFFYVAFKDVATKRIVQYSAFDADATIPSEGIREFVKGRTLIGFNSLAYDDFILLAIISRKALTPKAVHELSDQLIGIKGSQWQKDRFFCDWVSVGLGLGVTPRKIWKSIDVASCVTQDTGDAGGAYLAAGLKKLAAILQMPSIRTLPYPPGSLLTKDQADEVTAYCQIDVDDLEHLYENQKTEIELKKFIAHQTGLDVINRNRAGLAEDVLIAEYCRRTNTSRLQIRRSIPDYQQISLKDVLDKNFQGEKTPVTQQVYETLINRTIEIGDRSVAIPVQIGARHYDFKLGGLHSQDAPEIFRSSAEVVILHADVASYYPSLIQTLHIFPRHLGPLFAEIVGSKKESRLQAKAAAKKAKAEGSSDAAELQMVDASLKVQLVSFFGKLGQKGSLLYDPQAMLQVTVNGQLYLLELIEMLSQDGHEVLTSNTDGLFVRVQRTRAEQAKAIIQTWQNRHGPFVNMEVEELEFYARFDTNDYMYGMNEKIIGAVGDFMKPGVAKGKVKQEGIPVVVTALQHYVATGTSPAQTIRACSNPYDFLIIKSTKSQFHLDGNPLTNRIVRVALSKTAQNHLATGQANKLTKQNARYFKNICIVNDISQFSWEDLDRDRYIAEAERLISILEGREEPTTPGKKLTSETSEQEGDVLFDLPPDIERLSSLARLYELRE